MICERCHAAPAKKTLPMMEHLQTVRRRLCPRCFGEALLGLRDHIQTGDRTKALAGFACCIEYLIANPHLRIAALNIAWREPDDDRGDGDDEPEPSTPPVTNILVPIH